MVAVYKLGDDDPTPDDLSEDEICGAVSSAGTVCTWAHGHGGQHVAGTGEYVAEAWSEVCPECKGEAGWHWRACSLRPKA